MAAEGRLPDSAGRLHRRRLQRHRPVLSVPRRPVRQDGRRGGRRPWHRDRRSTPPRSTGGRPGVLHGNRTYLLQDDDGQITEAHSISAGLDYPGIGPEHSWLHDVGRVEYISATDNEALDAFQLLLAAGGHHPGAGAGACAGRRHPRCAPTMPKDRIMLVMNLCGRGDKDIFTVADALGVKM